jgi:hypothetical protein
LICGCSLFSNLAAGPKKITPPSKRKTTTNGNYSAIACQGQSARITSIQFAEGTYYFSDGGGTVPHLTAVSGVDVSDYHWLSDVEPDGSVRRGELRDDAGPGEHEFSRPFSCAPALRRR